ncbi:hypothetical protein DPMN_090469 [Dreissena polymorpha]|uniref:Uncharacterized protein n=1 Tax=Dreissena polymorpha TaxID=45954 RepID=A0A9D4KXS7_DREPO|nr:hypothetical protein DPMN_090469 [Dreissena polymorpha]
MEDMQRLKLQYVAAMANQEVVQQQLNIDRFLRGRLKWRRGARARTIWIRPWLHSGRRRQFGIYDQLMVELRRSWNIQEILRTPTEMYDTILGRFVIAS